MKISLAHAGKQHSYQVAKAMNELGVLDQFYTSGYANSLIQKLSKNLPGNPFQRRFIEGLPAVKVTANWHFELKENWIRRVKKNPVLARKAVYERDISFDRYMANKILSSTTSHFWGFQGSCHDTLMQATKTGKVSVCELATAHINSAKKILGEESKLHPDWALTIDNLVFPSSYEKRLEEEPHLADHVVAASSFTKATLIEGGVSVQKIKVLPLGCSLDMIPFQLSNFKPYKERPFKLLYAGRVTQRKGMCYLLEALKNFKPSEVELHIIGQMNGAEKLLKPFEDYIHYHGSKSQRALYNSYCDFDALVLPSVFEGFGLVIVEAMAAGLPVITTPNTMGPEMIVEGKNGSLIPIRDVKALEGAITKLITLPADELLAMRVDARESALNFSWDKYQARLSKVLELL